MNMVKTIDNVKENISQQRGKFKIPIAVTIKEVRETVRQWRKEGLSVGLVPTMGYLHEGHESLIKRAVAENDMVVVSVFVNPMQFGPKEDLASYPRDIEADSRLCEAAGASLIFHPEPEEMYEEGFCSFVDMTGLTNALCGLSRPVHFRGVCTVVNKLFNIVMPDRAYFGEKDAQQLAVVKRMVKDLNMDIEIVGCPIIREADGLAKSSRNTYLSPESRKQAVILSKSIFMAKKMIEDGERDAAKVKQAMVDMINTMPLADIDYVEIVDVNTMQSIDKIEGDILCAIAVNIGGEARLIDNFMLSLSNA
ncbi:MAG: pantoate--beta-alanine ligase [Bacteroides sp.]|nr:pantoate--beta-alanine ligase [Bacteroides sp.]